MKFAFSGWNITLNVFNEKLQIKSKNVINKIILSLNFSFGSENFVEIDWFLFEI